MIVMNRVYQVYSKNMIHFFHKRNVRKEMRICVKLFTNLFR